MDIRTVVWEGMIEIDRLGRYYGGLASKLARIDKAMTVAVTVFAVGTVYSLPTGGIVTLMLALATVAASVCPLVFRYGNAILSASNCQTRLGELGTEWQALWLDVDIINEEEAKARWKELSKRQDGILAFQSSRPVDEKLNLKTAKDAHEYWTKKYAPREAIASPTAEETGARLTDGMAVST